MDYFLKTLGVAVGLVFFGNLFGKWVPLIRRFALPGAVLGGLIGLLVGPQLLAIGSSVLGAEEEAQLYGSFRQFPGIFINVVFACLMLGRSFAPPGRIWRRARRQIVMGHIYAWGQYVVGFLLFFVLLAPFSDLPPLVAPLIAIGFQGGHGTSAGLSSNFAAMNFAAGENLALAVATFGVVTGVVGGPFLANLLRKRHADISTEAVEQSKSDTTTNKPPPDWLRPNPLTGRLTVHLALVFLVIGCGRLFLSGLQLLEQTLRPAAETYLSDYLPLFSVVLLTGLALQYLLQVTRMSRLFERKLFERISSFALDMVIVGALATLSLQDINTYGWELLVLCLGGLGWNLAVFLLIGPRIYPKPWFAYGLGDLGGGTATTASGLMLVDVADPQRQTDALIAYTDKQPFYEPLMGGGVVTALALPTVAFWGAGVAFFLTAMVLLGWLLLAWRLVQK